MSHLIWLNGSFKISDIIPAGPPFCRRPRALLGGGGAEWGDTALPWGTCCEEERGKAAFGLLPGMGSVSPVWAFVFGRYKEELGLLCMVAVCEGVCQ